MPANPTNLAGPNISLSMSVHPVFSAPEQVVGKFPPVLCPGVNSQVALRNFRDGADQPKTVTNPLQVKSPWLLTSTVEIAERSFVTKSGTIELVAIVTVENQTIQAKFV